MACAVQSRGVWHLPSSSTSTARYHLERDGGGFILTGADVPHDGADAYRPREWPLDREPFWLESSVPGVFVAGDVRHGSVKRVAGVGEGAAAVQFIHRYLRSR